MHVLFVTHYTPFMGANRSLIGLIEGLADLGIRATVLVPGDGALTLKLREKNISYLTAPFHNWVYTRFSPAYLSFPIKYIQNKQGFTNLSRQVAELSPDLIYTNSSMTPIGAWLSDALNIPHIWHIREFVKEHYGTHYLPSHKHFLYWMNKASTVISISHALADTVLKDVHVPKHIIYNGIINKADLDKLPLPVKGNKPYTFLNIGLIHPMKKQMEALKAFHLLHKSYPETRLILVGAGRRLYQYRLRRYCQRHKLTDVVELPGYVPNPKKYFEASDALLMCSRFEGMGRVTAEAMAWGRPVIGFKSGATPELVSHEQTGLIYENGVQDLRDCMERLLLDRESGLAYGLKGRERVREQFTLEAYVNSIKNLLNESLKIS